MYKIIIFLAFAACASAQIKTYGHRVFTPLPYFDQAKLCGKWYMYSYIPNKFEPFNICLAANVTLNYDRTLKVINTGLNIETGFFQQWGGTAVSCGPLPSEFTFIFPSGAVQTEYQLKFLDGDANLEHYAVALLIQKLPNDESLEFVWIASRYPQLENKFYERALNVLQYNKIDTHALKFVKQHDCTSY